MKTQDLYFAASLRRLIALDCRQIKSAIVRIRSRRSFSAHFDISGDESSDLDDLRYWISQRKETRSDLKSLIVLS